ncbi:MAG TPA: mechanosensitive ion channel family protein [Gemmatimonadales bacterium]|nr:mechanosensitive ion channel family protein [Gemmatimonadales bacterium]
MIAALDTTDLIQIDARALLSAGVRVAVVWLLAWASWVAVRVVARRIELAVDDGDDSTLTAAEKRGQTIAQLLRSVGRVVIILIGLLLTLNLFIDIGPLLAGAGILGLAVSFGAQSLVKDVISGFFVLFENQFAIGDVVEVAGKSGVVEGMTLRVTQLRDLEGRVHVIPNGQIGVVTNMTKGWSRAVLEIGVAYETDLDRALTTFRAAAAEFAADPAWAPLLDGAPEVPGVERFEDSAIVIRILLRTLPGKQWEVAREFRRRLKARLDAEGISIPFPQRVVRHIESRGAKGAEGA